LASLSGRSSRLADCSLRLGEGRNAYSKQWGDVNAAVVLSLIAINT
jgi:hypothetical protein